MRKLKLVSAFIATIFLGCAGQSVQPQQYTAHNIWHHKGDLFCINFKSGSQFVPAGTAVKDVDVDSNEISFRVAHTNQLIILKFVYRWHPGYTANSYLKKIITEKDIAELTNGLNPDEIDSIKKGIVTVGMSKRAVLISYGTPPEHYTPDLASNGWYYWMDRREKKKICFDENQRAIRCGYNLPDRL